MTNYDAYLVTRPLFAKFDRENGMPVIKKKNPKQMNIEQGKFLNLSNLKKANENSIILTFVDDNKLNRLWNNPLNYVSKFRGCLAVITPDFTIQKKMDLPLISSNVYKNRWLGCTYQQYGINVIPSISWAGKETYDICFSGFETNSIVAISTIGCRGKSERKVFLEDYNELLKRKSPSLVICYGGIIRGMSGRILPVEYKEGFSNRKYEYTPLFEMSKILDLKGDEHYGW